MRGSPRHGTAAGWMVLLNALLLSTQPAHGAITDHLLVQLRGDAQDEAHQLATQHGFQSARKLPFGEGLFHFYPQDASKRRNKRSTHRRQQLQKDNRVKDVFEQEGFSRQKRGYRNIDDIEVNMSDPLFTKQWYLPNQYCPCQLISAFTPPRLFTPGDGDIDRAACLPPFIRKIRGTWHISDLYFAF